MPLASSPSESHTHIDETSQRGFFASFFHLPRNVYLLLFFTLGKGFQLTIATLTVNYYAYSLGYHPDFIGLFSAMPALAADLLIHPGLCLLGLLGSRTCHC
jgi:hypothetical protein